ncbi:DNA-directed RNA polymerase subunit beta' [Candidatus Hodgkinia cicadicola]|uniref:DNA-directed RNA polymerase subunit n=2 Tax=Candidatus Hodgkinia cicadicola TaxID=573658 RepID=A0ABX4MJT3_9HYPH|nr:DNA-directed RNA polymerase subunit beta' [Candidatus Hodgkinia cicadicola]
MWWHSGKTWDPRVYLKRIFKVYPSSNWRYGCFSKRIIFNVYWNWSNKITNMLSVFSKNISNLRFKITSPETILSWSYGEICNADTYDNDGKPIIGGLFCPKIFGSRKKNECICSIPKIDNKMICQTCGIYLGADRLQTRSRFGHIVLSTPVMHTLFYKPTPNILAELLNMDVEIIQGIIDCELHVITESNLDEYRSGQIISTETYRNMWMRNDRCSVTSGGQAIMELLSNVQVKKIKTELTKEIKHIKSEELLDRIKNRLEIVEGFISNNISLDWLVIRILPVLPAELRPTIVLDDDTLVNSDLNILYKHIIIANNNHLITTNEIESNNIDKFDSYIEGLKLLQKVVDDLIDNSSNVGNPNKYNTPALKSLAEMLKGKRGRFRYNILGKRVDYSGRSVIVSGPNLSINECSIPRSMAVELFKPFIYSKLMLKSNLNDRGSIKKILEDDIHLTYKILEEVVSYCPVLLNRAPTLHKLSIRAFWVKLTNEKVIRLHPLVCSGFNADFDGDQMAVHVPLSFSARIEATTLLMANNNVMHPAHGDPCILPSQDMILGLYYMSLISPEHKDICLSSYNEVHKILFFKKINLHTKVKFRIIVNGKITEILSTPGRLLISELVPSECNFLYEWNYPEFSKQLIFDIIELVKNKCGLKQMTTFCEKLMRLGFKYATQSGMSLSDSDFTNQSYKRKLLRDIQSKTTKSWSKISNKQKISMPLLIWPKVLDAINNNINLEITGYSSKQTSIQLIVNSGARGTLSQIKQLIGSRGYIVGFDGKLCRLPILNSYNEGLSLIQFFYCTFSSRRGLIDTTLKTASSGYFTRKLVESTREWIISEDDCDTDTGLHVKPIINFEFIKNRLIGRFIAKPILINKKIIIKRNELITEYNICNILMNCNGGLWIRSPLTCQARLGICKRCYGIELGSGNIAQYGDSVGVLAAQSISEPGTQLTLRTFHGLTNGEDKTHREVIENCLISPFSGIVKIKDVTCIVSKSDDIIVVNSNSVLSIVKNGIELWKYKLLRGTHLLVSNNKYVEAEEILCFNCIKSKNLLSLVSGILFFENLVYYLNIKKQTHNITKKIITNIKPDVIRKEMSLIGLDVGRKKRLHYVSVNSRNKFIINPNEKINLFDGILEVSIEDEDEDEDENDMALTEGFERLSKLFDNSIDDDNISIISPIAGLLKHGTDSNGNRSFIIDPKKINEYPVVYSDLDVKLFIKENKMIKQGQIILHGDHDLSNYAEVYGFNDLFNYFISIVQEIYGNQGVNVNSKHIEMVLRQMTNTVSISNPGNSLLKVGCCYNWQDVSRINNYIKILRGKMVIGDRQIVGITNACVNLKSILSAISFQGAIKSVIKAIISNNNYEISMIKDKIMLGKVPLVGTGFINEHRLIESKLLNKSDPVNRKI